MPDFEKRSADLDKRLAELDMEKALFDKRAEIRTVKKSMRVFKPPTTTKLIMALLLINCTVVELYSMWAMVYLENLDALYALITAVIGETVSFLIYAAKAFAETKAEEEIKLERDKLDAGTGYTPDEEPTYDPEDLEGADDDTEDTGQSEE